MNSALDISRYIINYSNEKNYGISNLKLQKILYLQQAHFLIKTGRPCFKEEIEAWSFGPVVREVYDEYKQFGGLDIPTITFYFESEPNAKIWESKKVKYNQNSISENDRNLVEDVVNAFKDYTATDLVALTHSQDPWIKTYIKGQDNIITIDSLKEYFKK